MSTRERWIVFPLLFLTLGIALRDKIVPPERIRCKQLQADAVLCGRIQANQAECRALLVEGPNGRPIVAAGADANAQAGLIETFTAAGQPQVRLLSTDAGGMVTTFGHQGKVLLVMGHVSQGFGVFAQVPELGPPIQLTLPWRFEAKPSATKPQDTAPAQEKPSEKP